MSRLFHADALRHWNQAVNSQVGHCLMGILHGIRIEFHPTGIGKLNETTRGSLQALQIGCSQFQAFLLPLRRDGQPIDAAAFDNEARP